MPGPPFSFPPTGGYRVKDETIRCQSPVCSCRRRSEPERAAPFGYGMKLLASELRAVLAEERRSDSARRQLAREQLAARVKR